MSHELNTNNEDIKVSILFTESTSSFLNLTVPYLEDLHPSDHQVCVITPSETNYKKPIRCAADIRHRNRFKDWDSKLTSEIGLFSDSMKSSTTLFDDLSNLSLTEELERKESLPCILRPRKIHTRPLVTVRSMAHSNNLNIYSNKIIVSLLDYDGELSAEYMCRICHGGDSIDDLLTPCRCRGTVALAHLGCLQRWLKESAHSYCELCQHHYQIIREPRYGLLESVYVYLRHPGDHLKELLLDILALIVYTPSAIVSNYMLLIICESVARINLNSRSTLSTHLITFTALLGIAAIDFTYTSWLFATLERHIEQWSDWYRSNCTLRVILPRTKMRPHRFRRETENVIQSTTSQESCMQIIPQ